MDILLYMLLFVIAIAVLFLLFYLAMSIPIYFELKKKEANGIAFAFWIQHNCQRHMTMFENRPIWHYEGRIYDSDDLYVVYKKIKELKK